MSGSVTHGAQRDEIFLRIASRFAPRANVLDLKILRDAAVLASPPLALEHSATELPVTSGSSLSRGRFYLNRLKIIPHDFEQLQLLGSSEGADQPSERQEQCSLRASF